MDRTGLLTAVPCLATGKKLAHSYIATHVSSSMNTSKVVSQMEASCPTLCYWLSSVKLHPPSIVCSVHLLHLYLCPLVLSVSVSGVSFSGVPSLFVSRLLFLKPERQHSQIMKGASVVWTPTTNTHTHLRTHTQEVRFALCIT